MMWGYGPWSTAEFGWHFIPMVLWWVFLLLIVVGMFRWVFGVPRRRRYQEDNAVQIVRQRYAKGEITKEEFDRLKADLGG